MKPKYKKTKRTSYQDMPNLRFSSKIKDLFSMSPLKIDQAEKLPKEGGIFLVTDLDGMIHPRISKGIRGHAVRVCSTNPKSDLARDIALRRSGLDSFPAPNGKRTKKYLFEHNRKLIALNKRALGELPLCDIRFVVEDDDDRRKLLKQYVDMELGNMEWRAQNEPRGKQIGHAIGHARN